MRQSINTCLLLAALTAQSMGISLREHSGHKHSLTHNFFAQQTDARACDTTFVRLSDPAMNPDIDSMTGVFTDESFAEAEALGSKTVSHWSRAMDFLPASEGFSLFKDDAVHSISFNDVDQMALGDCWVLSAMASIAEHPQRIWDMFPQKTLNEHGAYSIRMHSLGVPINVIIDDYVPGSSWGSNT